LGFFRGDFEEYTDCCDVLPAGVTDGISFCLVPLRVYNDYVTRVKGCGDYGQAKGVYAD